ncbi:MAG: DUF5679 domain-containing protein [Thermoplasmata archaeon]
MAKEYMGYDMKAKKMVKIQNPQIVKLKNGRKAAKGKSPVTGTTVYRILGKKDL